MTQYLDLGDIEEDKRIALIGHRAVDHRETVAFIVEDDAKADRYIQKLTAKFPMVEVFWRGKGPVADTIAVKIKRKADA